MNRTQRFQPWLAIKIKPLSLKSFVQTTPLALATLALAALALLLPTWAWAQSAPGLPAWTSAPGPGGTTTYSLSVQTLVLMTSLTFIPPMVLMMSGFTRIIIVLSLLRHALGTQTTPPTQVLVGLAMFLTFFVMSPVLERVYEEAYLPLSQNKINMMQAAERAAVPVKTFMLRQTREADIALFAKLSNAEPIAKAEDTPMKVLIPAFVTSELKTAFQIAFVVYIPFLVIDMVVATLLMAMGMMMMSPVMISLPFKIILFVLVDGWGLLIGSLVKSFGPLS